MRTLIRSMTPDELAFVFRSFPSDALVDLLLLFSPDEVRQIIGRTPADAALPAIGQLPPETVTRIFGPPSKALEAELGDVVGGREFASLDELNSALGAHFEARNSRPLDDFCGLSADQMQAMLEGPHRCGRLFEFAERTSAEPHAPAALVLGRLVEAAGRAGGIKPTATGNLPLVFCRETQEALYTAFATVRPKYGDRLRSEEDFALLHAIHVVAKEVGYVRTYRGRIVLGREARDLLKKGGMQVLFPHFLAAYSMVFNWGYLDRLPELPFIQRSYLYPLYLLHRFGETWRPQVFYEDLYLRAFPTVLSEVPPHPYRDAESDVRLTLTWQFFARFALWFGFAAVEPVSTSEGLGTREHFRIRKGPMFDQLVQIRV